MLGIVTMGALGLRPERREIEAATRQGLRVTNKLRGGPVAKLWHWQRISIESVAAEPQNDLSYYPEISVSPATSTA